MVAPIIPTGPRPTEQQKQAVELRNEGLTHEQIAERMNLGRAAVTRLLQRAKASGFSVFDPPRKPRSRRLHTIAISQIGGEARRHINAVLGMTG